MSKADLKHKKETKNTTAKNPTTAKIKTQQQKNKNTTAKKTTTEALA